MITTHTRSPSLPRPRAATGLLLLFLAATIGVALPLQAKLTPEQLAKLPPAATGPVDFARDIKPLFEASCIKCHGRGKAKGGFKLDTRETFLKGGESGPVAQAGHSAESYLIELVSGLNPDEVMPVKGSKLTPAQVGLLRAWIDQGSPWDAGVTFAKPPPLNLHPRQPALPEVPGVTHPVDRLLRVYLQQHQLKEARPVEDRVFARRVHLDGVGLPPTPQELDQFAADKRPDKRERLVERLLGDSARFAQHWLSFWNDLLRNDYRGTGYIDGGREQISAWLYAALSTNMPYDRFVAELIHPNAKSAGFTKGIVWRGTVNASQLPPMQAAQNISQVFMGVNLKCASCHDSFINDWALNDAYALANIYADAPLEVFQCDKPTGRKAPVGFLYPELGSIPAGATKAERTQRLAELMTGRENGRLTRTVVNRFWARLLGRGLIEPVDDMEQVAWNPDLLDWLSEDLAGHGYDLKRTLRWILTSRAYQLPAISLDEQKRPDYVFTGPAVRRLSAEQFRDALGTLTGVWYPESARSVSPVVPGVVEAGSPPLPTSVRWIWNDAQAATQARPETLYFHKTFTLDELPASAWAVAAADNSYTLYVNGAKVVSGKEWNAPNLVNLQPHLRKGLNLVAVIAVNHTPDNKPPAADAPVKSGEANPAGFVFSARLEFGARRAAMTIGSDASWAWSRRKADGWEKPGSTLAEAAPAAELGPVSMGPWQLAEALASTAGMSRAHGDVRSSLVAADPLAVALGRPNREQVISTRASAATTLQALELTNGDTLNQVLKEAARKVLAQAPASSPELATQLYRKAIGRPPNARELRAARELLGQPAGQEQVEDLLWSLAMLPEFQLIY